MARAFPRALAAGLGLAVLVSGCAWRGPGGGVAGEVRSGSPGAPIEIAFEEVEVPEIFARAGRAVRDGEGTPGLWAAVAGLPRPERGVVRRSAGGGRVVVALYAAPPGSGAIRLSEAAADALGIGPEADATVSVVAVRREPRLLGSGERF